MVLPGGEDAEELKDVQDVTATSDAFAAVIQDGSVVTWGRADCGGDSSAVQEQLCGVKQITGTRCNTLCYSGGVISDTGAFAAILSDGSVVTWGSAECGGDSSSVQHQLKDVQDIAATSSAFAARLKDGSVVSWGQGGVWQEQDPLRRVRHIEGSDDAFAAILDDDSVVTWGSGHGAHSCHVESQLRGEFERRSPRGTRRSNCPERAKSARCARGAAQEDPKQGQTPARKARRISERSPLTGDGEEIQELYGIEDTAVRHGFVQKVFGILLVQLVTTTLVGGLVMKLALPVAKSNPALAMALMLGSLVLSIACMCIFACCPQTMRQTPTNYLLLALFTLAESVLVGFISAHYTQESVLLVLATTCIVVVSLILFACQTKYDITGYLPYVLVACMGLFGFGFILTIAAFCGMGNSPVFQTMRLVYSMCGVLVFSCFIVLDTQLIVGGKHSKFRFGVDDYCMAAINLYMDIVQLFLMALTQMLFLQGPMQVMRLMEGKDAMAAQRQPVLVGALLKLLLKKRVMRQLKLTLRRELWLKIRVHPHCQPSYCSFFALLLSGAAPWLDSNYCIAMADAILSRCIDFVRTNEKEILRSMRPMHWSPGPFRWSSSAKLRNSGASPGSKSTLQHASGSCKAWSRAAPQRGGMPPRAKTAGQGDGSVFGFGGSSEKSPAGRLMTDPRRPDRGGRIIQSGDELVAVNGWKTWEEMAAFKDLVEARLTFVRTAPSPGERGKPMEKASPQGTEGTSKDDVTADVLKPPSFAQGGYLLDASGSGCLWQRRQKDKSLGTLRRSEDDRTSECKTPSLSAALIGKSQPGVESFEREMFGCTFERLWGEFEET
eukprot:g18123.t1